MFESPVKQNLFFITVARGRQTTVG